MFNWLKDKFQPTRQGAFGFEGHVVADLDKMLAVKIPFRWNGKIHFIKPILTKEYFALSETLAQVNQLVKQEKISAEELLQVYANVITSVCDSIGKKEIAQMTQAQVGAIYQLILDAYTGKAYGEKKSPLIMEPLSEVS